MVSEEEASYGILGLSVGIAWWTLGVEPLVVAEQMQVLDLVLVLVILDGLASR